MLALVHVIRHRDYTLQVSVLILEVVAVLFGLDQLIFGIGVSGNVIASLRILGLVLFTAGIAITFISRIRLNDSYCPAAIKGEPKELVTSGLYCHVRHPIYFGAILFGLGFESILSSPFVFVIFLSIPIFLRQINREEELLKKTFPCEWSKFVKRTPYKLIPFLF